MDDRRREDNGQGDVQRDDDRRLKENRDDTRSQDRDQNQDRDRQEGDWEPGQTGAVKDPEHDGRLKENREDGVTLGSTEHSKQAPNVHQRDDR